jgi:hypothetical protein
LLSTNSEGKQRQNEVEKSSKLGSVEYFSYVVK